MATVEFRMDRKGVGDLLRSEPVQRDLDARSAAVARAAGPGHEASPRGGRTRARAQVRTSDRKTAIRERQTHALVAALDAARR